MKRIACAIGISSFLLIVMVQKSANDKMRQQEQLDDSLAVAMSQTLEEIAEDESYGISNQNEMMAAFLQAMLRKIDQDVDLTIKVHQINYVLKQMDIEAIGKYKTVGGEPHTVSIRRKITV